MHICICGNHDEKDSIVEGWYYVYDYIGRSKSQQGKDVLKVLANPNVMLREVVKVNPRVGSYWNRLGIGRNPKSFVPPRP